MDGDSCEAVVRSARELDAFEARAARLAGRALRAEAYGSVRLEVLGALRGACLLPRAALLAPGLVLRCAPCCDGGVALRLQRVGPEQLPVAAGSKRPRPTCATARAAA
jgi:hypothetical protein